MGKEEKRAGAHQDRACRPSLAAFPGHLRLLAPSADRQSRILGVIISAGPTGGNFFCLPQGGTGPAGKENFFPVRAFSVGTALHVKPYGLTFREKTRFFRLVLAGLSCAAASHFAFFKGKTLYPLQAPGLPRRTLPAQVLPPVLNLIPTFLLSLGSAQRRSCTWTTPARSLTSPPNIDRATLFFPEKAPSCHKNVTKISYLLQKAAKRRLCLWQVTTRVRTH